ncbi:MAG: hypothetical protein JWN99_2106, partial [Ilumatobacteraceae bacterium]|nr:hypothetical protein [Ilumatobacteraceae bacterium]
MIDEAIDSELEARLRATYHEMVPKLVDGLVLPNDDVWIDAGTEELLVAATPRALPPRRGLVAAGLLVAATIVGLVVVAQRDRDQSTPTDVSTDVSTSVEGEPTWYQLMRPLIPERFAYASLVMREPTEIQVVGVGASDGKALEVTLRSDKPASSQPTTTVIDDLGYWAETPQGWQVHVAESGLTVIVTCDIGARGRDFAGPPNYCDMESTGAFTKAE